jgi:hypothetical protein
MKKGTTKTKKKTGKAIPKAKPVKPVRASRAKSETGSVALVNGKHEAFARAVALEDQIPVKAYAAIFGPGKNAASVAACTSRLLKEAKSRIEYLRGTVTAQVQKRAVIKKTDAVLALLDTMDIPITAVERAVRKAQKDGHEKKLTPEERQALLLCSETGQTMFGPKYKMTALLDRWQLIGKWLGFERQEVELGPQTLGDIAAMWASIRMGRA